MLSMATGALTAVEDRLSYDTNFEEDLLRFCSQLVLATDKCSGDVITPTNNTDERCDILRHLEMSHEVDR